MPPRWYLQRVKGSFSPMRKLACSSAGDWLAAVRVIHAGEVMSEVPDKDSGSSDLKSWGLGVGTIFSPHQNSAASQAQKRGGDGPKTGRSAATERSSTCSLPIMRLPSSQYFQFVVYIIHPHYRCMECLMTHSGYFVHVRRRGGEGCQYKPRTESNNFVCCQH